MTPQLVYYVMAENEVKVTRAGKRIPLFTIRSMEMDGNADDFRIVEQHLPLKEAYRKGREYNYNQ